MAKKTKQPIDWRVSCTAIIALVGLQMFAWYMGKNGIVSSAIMFLVGSVVGFTQPQIKILK